MVNTFLLCSNFQQSAKLLDNRRLGKQRVEAMQVKFLLDDLKVIAHYLKETNLKELQTASAKIRYITGAYKKLPYYLARTFHTTQNENQNNNHQVTKKILKEVKEKELKEKKSFTDTERVMKLGFVYHPIVAMWYGFEDALSEYIDAHIKEWIDRGYKNTLTISNIKASTYPVWVSNVQYHENFKSALLQKERDRKEKPWYQNKDEFKLVENFTGYLWIKK